MTSAAVRPDPLREHVRRVDAVAAIAAPPAAWIELRARFTAFLDLNKATRMRDRLAAAVIEGDTGTGIDLELLRACALAELAGPETAATVANGVGKAVLAELARIYAQVAIEAYGKVAAAFNTTADTFTAATELVDVEAEGSAMVDKSDRNRRAWLDAQKLAVELDRLVPVVVSAVELAGLDTRGRRDDGGVDAVLIALLTDPGDAWQVRRPLWEEAWPSKGRCGRWPAVLRAGARIRAWPSDKLAEFTPYRAPMPLQRREKPAKGEPYGTYEVFFIDPEDPAVQAELELESAPRRQRMQFLR